jgi:predicted house-cleaning NTP pyrophosphatase (Maf/HAM1 superfamily)
VENVEDLTGAVTSADWTKVRALLPPLKRRLSEADGSFQRILKDIDMDNLDVAIRSAKTLVKAVAAGGAEVSAETAQAMILQCDRIAERVDEIYGKLKYLRAEEVQ